MALCEKLFTPLNLTTGRPNLSGKYCNQTLGMSRLQLGKNFGPLIFAELLQFSNLGGFPSMNHLSEVLLQHRDGTQVRTLTRLLRGGLPGVFLIIVLLQLEVMNRWLGIFLECFLVESRICGSIHHSKSSRS